MFWVRFLVIFVSENDFLQADAADFDKIVWADAVKTDLLFDANAI